MPPAKLPQRLVLLVVSASLTAAVLAQAQSTPPSSDAANDQSKSNSTASTSTAGEVVTLSPFTVNTERDRGYYSSASAAGSVLASKPIKEIAMAISVVNRDLLDDLQTMNIGEALQFSASFSPESGLIRGQGALDPSGQFTNRVGNSTNGVPDSFSVERIELIKGPPSVLMSSSSAGGSVNVTPKRPGSTNFNEVGLQYGNYQKRYWVEGSHVLTPTLGLRIGIQYTDADFNGSSFQQQTNIPEFDQDKRWVIFGAATWRPFKNTELGIDVEQVRDRANAGNRTSLRFASVTQNGQTVRLPWYLAYDMPLDYSITGPDVLIGKDHRYITGRWTQKWSDHIRSEANIYNQWYNEKNILNALNLEESNTVPGLNGKRAIRVSSLDKTQLAQRTTQIAFRTLFDYSIGETKHQLVLKYNYYTFYTDSVAFRAYTRGTNSLTGLVAANEIKGPWFQVEGVTAAQLNGYDRRLPVIDPMDYLWRYTQDAHDNPHRHQGNIIYTGEYPTKIGTFFPMAGVSYHSQIESYQTKFALVNGVLTNPTSLSRPHRWGSAPSAGVVYQITPALGVYASYLESFQVPSNFNSFNELLPNREGVSFETGVKLDLWDRKVTGTLSYFDTTDKNRPVADAGAFNINTRDVNGNGPRDPGFDPNNLAANTSRGDTVAVGEYNSKGFDFEVTLQPTSQFQATVSATFVDAGVKSDPNPSFIGQKLNGFAEQNYGTVLSYRFTKGRLKGLSVGGGYRYTSDRYLSRVRQFTTVVGSPYIDYWQPPTESLLFFSKYNFKVGKYKAYVQVNGDNLTGAKKYINETSFTTKTIFGMATPKVWRITTGTRF